MNNRTIAIRLTTACFLALAIAPTLKAEYYMPNFFPIGFTGFDYESPSGLGWSINWSKERELLKDSKCNFVGCPDALAYRYLNADTSGASPQESYYTEVSMELLKETPPCTIMVVPNGAYGIKRVDLNEDGDAADEGERWEDPGSLLWWAMFKNPLYENGYAPYAFKDCKYYEHDGIEHIEIWDSMATEAAKSYAAFFDKYENDVSDFCLWGYNPFHESHAIYRGGAPGVYAADTFVTNILRWEENEGSSPLYGETRMITAKCQLWPLMQQNSGNEVNLFEHVPEIDAILIYMYRPYGDMAYGSQELFDLILYGDDQPQGGVHNAAAYMQRNGNTNLRPNQKRRWMAAPQAYWEFFWDANDNREEVKFRRACPPEIRAMTYLALSRGAKGILYYMYLSYLYRDGGGTNIPNLFPTSGNYYTCRDPSSVSGTTYLGLRDSTGHPCATWYMDSTGRDTIRLMNVGYGDNPDVVYYWDNTWDTTWSYLCNLIPEIKLIAPTLMQLDWVNGYSLNSTDPNWVSPCPHYYVQDVWGVEYADLGFFDHPYEPIGVEYFMLVNREGIADMTNRNVSVVLDAGHWPEADSLILTNIANKDNPRTLTREGKRFIFSEEFEPGEGKLYRVAPAQEPPITYISKGGAR